MRVKIPLEPQGAKRPRVNSKLNSAYYDTAYREWLRDAMQWVEDYLLDTDLAMVKELLGTDKDGNQYKNTHIIKGFKKLKDIEYKTDVETGLKVVKNRNVALDENGDVILDKDGYVLSLSGQKIPILGKIRDDYLGLKARILFILPRRNNRETRIDDRPFPVDANTSDIDNYAKSIIDAFFENPMFKETGLNDRHIQSLLLQKRYAKPDEDIGIIFEIKAI